MSEVTTTTSLVVAISAVAAATYIVQRQQQKKKIKKIAKALPFPTKRTPLKRIPLDQLPKLKNDLLLRALRGERTERVPVWCMRQAGRCVFLTNRKGVNAAEIVPIVVFYV